VISIGALNKIIGSGGLLTICVNFGLRLPDTGDYDFSLLDAQSGLEVDPNVHTSLLSVIVRANQVFFTCCSRLSLSNRLAMDIIMVL
jgi:hypothetical protein